MPFLFYTLSCPFDSLKMGLCSPRAKYKKIFRRTRIEKKSLSVTSLFVFHVYDKTVTAAALNCNLFLSAFQNFSVHFQMS